VAAYRADGLDGLRRCGRQGPASDLAAYRDVIRESFERQPVSTISEACVRIEPFTRLRRGLTQVRLLLKELGLKWQRIRAIPVPPKKRISLPSRPSGRGGAGWVSRGAGGGSRRVLGPVCGRCG
jgi:transposase